MQTYELTYILSPEMTSEEAQAWEKEMESAIQKNGGVIIKQTNPLARTLSFQIKGHASGFFGLIEFDLEPENLHEIQELAKKDAKISRHMLLAKKHVRIKKQRRARAEVLKTAQPEEKKEEASSAEPEPAQEKPQKGKVELKDIEEQLDEILGE